MYPITCDQSLMKYGYVTHAAPLDAMTSTAPLNLNPRIGDLVMAEVLKVGRNKRLESRTGVRHHLFEGDIIVGAFGNRYATDHFEGYVPREPVEVCDLLTSGGVIGQVASQNEQVSSATRLRIIGALSDAEGVPMNLRSFGLHDQDIRTAGEIILVLGSSMSSGKTTTAGALAYSLRRSGFSVAAGKLTGSAAGKDVHYYRDAGANPVFDFTDAGYPSTYMLNLDELLSIQRRIVASLRASRPDYIVLEVADGIFQRETRMMLENAAFAEEVDHVYFAAGDSLAVHCGVRQLSDYGLPLRGTSGSITASPLASREAEEITGVPCLRPEKLVEGGALRTLSGEFQINPSFGEEAAESIG